MKLLPTPKEDTSFFIKVIKELCPLRPLAGDWRTDTSPMPSNVEDHTDEYPILSKFYNLDTYLKEDETIRYQGYFKLTELSVEELQTLAYIMLEDDWRKLQFINYEFEDKHQRLIVLVGHLDRSLPF